MDELLEGFTISAPWAEVMFLRCDRCPDGQSELLEIDSKISLAELVRVACNHRADRHDQPGTI